MQPLLMSPRMAVGVSPEMKAKDELEKKYKDFCNEIAPPLCFEDPNKPALDEDKLNIKMETFYADAKTIPAPPTSELSDILKGNFIVGESHHDFSPKKFLIDIMPALKKTGFKIIFIEHLYYDDQALLDDFYRTGKMTPQLEKRFNQISSMFFDLPKHYDFSALAFEAQAAGIRIVAIDTRRTYAAQYAHQGYCGKSTDDFRTQSMNFTAAQIIKKESDDNKLKWCALIGNSHVKSFSEKMNNLNPVIGCAELTGARTLYITDKETMRGGPKVTIGDPRSPIMELKSPDIAIEVYLEPYHHYPYEFFLSYWAVPLKVADMQVLGNYLHTLEKEIFSNNIKKNNGSKCKYSNSLFGRFGFDKTIKHSAARKMICFLSQENYSLENFTTEEVKALQQGRLGEIIENIKDQNPRLELKFDALICFQHNITLVHRPTRF